jgi:hypothetical protein
MERKGKWKSFAINDKINILAQVHVETRVELASYKMRLSVSTLNAAVKTHEKIERS